MSSLEMINQLRRKYHKAADEYGERFFNTEKLEERIKHFILNKGNLENFLAQEMEFFQKTMNLAKEKSEQDEKRKAFSQKVDEIMAENDARLAKYPDIFFDTAASMEIRRLVGAITAWYQKNFTVLKLILRGSDLWSELSRHVGDLERFYIPRGSAPTVLLRHYVDELKLGKESRETIERKLLQTCSLSLYTIERNLQQYRKTSASFLQHRQVEIPRHEDPGLRDKWAGVKEDEALAKMVYEIDEIIGDFRMKDLARHGYERREEEG